MRTSAAYIAEGHTIALSFFVPSTSSSNYWALAVDMDYLEGRP